MKQTLLELCTKTIVNRYLFFEKKIHILPREMIDLIEEEKTKKDHDDDISKLVLSAKSDWGCYGL